MRSTIIARHTPLIRFLGKRSLPKNETHEPKAHPQAPGGLPNSFASYRQTSQNHGPLGRSGFVKGADEVAEGVFAAISDLPKRFHYSEPTEDELEAINSGGATAIF